jgi:hypothetical protein
VSRCSTTRGVFLVGGRACYSRSVLRALVVALALVAGAALVRADIEGEQFQSGAWRVRLSAPRGWQLTEKTAYPSVLLRMVRRAPDGKMLLTAEHIKPGTDARAYALKTVELLKQMRFEVRAAQLHSSTGAYFVDSHRGDSHLRQAFLVSGAIGYSLTLEAPTNRIRSQHLRAFDYTLRSIQILRPEEIPAAIEADEKKKEQTSPPPPEPKKEEGGGT